MTIIAHMKQKGNAFLGRIPEGTLTLLVVVLTGVAGFGLGILYERDAGQGRGFSIEQMPQAAAVHSAASPEALSAVSEVPESVAITAGGEYVASKKGTKYHFPWCPGAKVISEANKIWFPSKEAAEAAGYTKAANCKGL